MGLLAPFEQRLVLRLIGPSRRSPPLSSAIPPAPPGESTPRRPATRAANVEIARFLVHVLLADAAAITSSVAELEASVDELVVAWSPSMCTTSRTELVATLLEGDDAITDVVVTIVVKGSPGAPSSWSGRWSGGSPTPGS